MYGNLAVLAAFACVYGVVAGRLEKTPVNGPVVFLAFGILAGLRSWSARPERQW